MVAHEIPPLEAHDAAAESGGVDPGARRHLGERWLMAGADSHQKAEVLCSDARGSKAGIVVARECPRGDPGLEGRVLGFDAAREARMFVVDAG